MGRWTTLWHVGLTFLALAIIPSLLAGAIKEPGMLSPAGILLLFSPGLIGAVLALIPRWREGDAVAGALAAAGIMVITSLPLVPEGAWRLATLAAITLAGLWFAGIAVAGTCIALLVKARIFRRPS